MVTDLRRPSSQVAEDGVKSVCGAMGTKIPLHPQAQINTNHIGHK